MLAPLGAGGIGEVYSSAKRGSAGTNHFQMEALSKNPTARLTEAG